MKIAVEISMYPLLEEYFVPIEDFIAALHLHKGLSIRTNAMSTQIFGEADSVLGALQTELKNFLSKPERLVFVTKFINADLEGFKERR